MRQNVQKALNRGENYHQLRRAVSFASFGKLRFKTEYEQDLWSECSRLIANCIIFYNASLLSHLLEHQEKSGDTQGAEAVKKISPIAWQHINLHGRYEFQKPLDPLDVDAIIREMTGFRPDRITWRRRHESGLNLFGALGKNPQFVPDVDGKGTSTRSAVPQCLPVPRHVFDQAAEPPGRCLVQLERLRKTIVLAGPHVRSG